MAQRYTFDEWMTAVDVACKRLSGLSIHDLPDQPFRDEYEAGTGPATVAKRALREEGWG